MSQSLTSPIFHSPAVRSYDSANKACVADSLQTIFFAMLYSLHGGHWSQQLLPQISSKPALPPTQRLHMADKSIGGKAGPAFRRKDSWRHWATNTKCLGSQEEEMLSKALLRYETVVALSTTREGNGARRGEEAYELCWHCLYTLPSAEREREHHRPARK